jgi:hypothetical protein
MTILGPANGVFTFRGVDRIVGRLIQPSEVDAIEQAAKGLFHELFPPHMLGVVASPSATHYLTANPAAQATMLLNNVRGCCAEAADLHIDASRCANAGAPYLPTDDDSDAAYRGATGYDGTPATDRGTDPLRLMAWRKTNPYPSGSVLLDSVNVQPSRAMLSQGIWLCTGLLGWACLPQAWESLEDAGDVWDLAGPPVPTNGHMFGLLDYTDAGPIIETWGEQIQMTWAAAKLYLSRSAGGGVVAPLDTDCISRVTSKTPSGFDLSALTRYVQGLPAPSLLQRIEAAL